MKNDLWYLSLGLVCIGRLCFDTLLGTGELMGGTFIWDALVWGSLLSN